MYYDKKKVGEHGMSEKKASVKTKKRQLIIAILEQENRWLSAEEIHQISSTILPMNSSTVYRGLHALLESGIVEKNVRHDQIAYFRIVSHNHKYRLVCTICQAKIPVDICPFEELEEDLAKTTGFQITGHSLEFSGVCPKCAKKNKEQ